MAEQERLVVDPVLNQRYIFRHVTADDGTAVAQVEFWVEPGGGVVPHLHPNFEERFEVLSGEITFGVGRDKVVAHAGDEAVVPPGTRHTYKNTGSETAHAICDASPARPELQQFLEDAAALARAGKYTRHALPKSPSGALALAVMADHYRATTLILTIPPVLHPLLLRPLAKLGARRGYRAGHFDD
jgi:quercetin dioxygenase-like cupin family protein